jgi:hypothetical protein
LSPMWEWPTEPQHIYDRWLIEGRRVDGLPAEPPDHSASEGLGQG